MNTSVTLFLALTALIFAHVECQGEKGYMNGPAARTRKLSEDREGTSRSGSEVENSDDAHDDAEHEEYHRNAHTEGCLDSIQNTPTQVRKQTIRSQRLQSGVKGGLRSQSDRSSQGSETYSQSPSSRYMVSATSSSSAIVGPQAQGTKRRFATTERRRVTRRRAQSAQPTERTFQRDTSGQNFDFCMESRTVGPCRGAIPRYWYNTENGMCEEFLYGGCQGNSNNFETSDECMNTCSARGSRRIVVDTAPITQQKALYQRSQSGVKGGYTTTSSTRSSRVQNRGVKTAKLVEREEVEDVVPVIPRTVETVDSSFGDFTEYVPRQHVQQSKL